MEIKPGLKQILENDAVKCVQFRSSIASTNNEQLVLRILDCGCGSRVCVGIVPPDYRVDEEPGYGQFSIGYMGNINRVYQGSCRGGRNLKKHIPKNPQCKGALWKLCISYSDMCRTRVQLFIEDVHVYEQEISLQPNSVFAIVLKQAKVETNLEMTQCEGTSFSSSPTDPIFCATIPTSDCATTRSVGTAIMPSLVENSQTRTVQTLHNDTKSDSGCKRVGCDVMSKSFEVLPHTEFSWTENGMYLYVPIATVSQPTTMTIQREPAPTTDSGSNMYTLIPSNTIFNQTVYLRFPVSNNYDADSEYCLMYQASDEDDWETVEFGAHRNYHTSNCQNAPVWFIEDGYCHLMLKHFCKFYLLRKLVDWFLNQKRIALTWSLVKLLNMTTQVELKFHCPDMKTSSTKYEKSTMLLKLKRSSEDLNLHLEPIFCTIHSACPPRYVLPRHIWQGLCDFPNGYVMNIFINTEPGEQLPILNVKYSQQGDDKHHVLTLPLRNTSDATPGTTGILCKLKNFFSSPKSDAKDETLHNALRQFFAKHRDVEKKFESKCRDREKVYVDTYIRLNWTRSNEISAGASVIQAVCWKSCKSMVGRLELEDMIPALLSEGIITNTEKTQMMNILCDGTEQTRKKERRACLKFFSDILSSKSEDQFWKFIQILRDRQLQPVVINLLSNYFLEVVSRINNNSQSPPTTVPIRNSDSRSSSEDSGNENDERSPSTILNTFPGKPNTAKASTYQPISGRVHYEDHSAFNLGTASSYSPHQNEPLNMPVEDECKFHDEPARPVIPDFSLIGPDSQDTFVKTDTHRTLECASVGEDALTLPCLHHPSSPVSDYVIHHPPNVSSYAVNYTHTVVNADSIHYHNGSPHSTQSRHSTNLSPLFLLPDDILRSVIEFMAATPGQHVFEDLKGQLHLKELDTPDILLQCLLTLPMTSANMRYWVEFIDRLSMCSECGGGEVVENLAEWVSYAYIFHDENLMKLSSELIDETQLIFVFLGLSWNDLCDVNRRQAFNTSTEKNFWAFSRWRDINLKECTVTGFKNLTAGLSKALDENDKICLAHKFCRKYPLLFNR